MPESIGPVPVLNSVATTNIGGVVIRIQRTNSGPWLAEESRVAEGPWLRISYADSEGRAHLIELLNGRLTIDGVEPNPRLSGALRASVERLDQAMVEYNNQAMPGNIIGDVWREIDHYNRSQAIYERIGDKAFQVSALATNPQNVSAEFRMASAPAVTTGDPSIRNV